MLSFKHKLLILELLDVERECMYEATYQPDATDHERERFELIQETISQINGPQTIDEVVLNEATQIIKEYRDESLHQGIPAEQGWSEEHFTDIMNDLLLFFSNYTTGLAHCNQRR